MTKPTFFILGAPKCGTTSLAAWLAKHPDVYFSPEKEPHHYNTDMAHRIFPDDAAYLALFEETQGQSAIGEASVWYLYSSDAVRNIEREYDKPRYIICLRNPTDMAYSLHEQQVFSGNETETDFETAWRLADQRRTGRAIPKHAMDPTTLIYPDACAIGSQAKRVLEQVESDRIFFILMDDLKDKPRETFNAVQRFIGVEEDPTIALTVENAAKQRRSQVTMKVMQVLGRIKARIGMKKSLGVLRRMDAANRVEYTRPKMSAPLRAELLAHFDAEVGLIEGIVNRKLPHWHKQADG